MDGGTIGMFTLIFKARNVMKTLLNSVWKKILKRVFLECQLLNHSCVPLALVCSSVRDNINCYIADILLRIKDEELSGWLSSISV